MKVKTNNGSVESFGISEAGDFKIKASAKAFAILSSQIYTDKQLAICRELICNMYDAHVARDQMHDSGKSTPFLSPKGTPFQIKLPDAFESVLIFRDFGTGLSNEHVETIYTTYFESTKSDSDDYIGALGLGSKSPFCYVDNFTVTSYYNGTRSVYLMYIGEEGKPKPSLILKEEVDHTLPENKNGLEINIAVNQRDYYSFRNAAKRVLTYFPVSSYTGVQGLGVTYYLEQVKPSIFECVYRCGGLTHDRVTVLQGNVAYPVKLSQLNFKDSQRHILQFFKQSYHLFNVPIGTVDVSASREELSYDKVTTKNLKMMLLRYYRAIRSDARQSLPSIDMPYWDRLKVYRDVHSRGMVYSKVVSDAVNARYRESGAIVTHYRNQPTSGYTNIVEVIPGYHDIDANSASSVYCECVATKYVNSRYYGDQIFYRKRTNRGRRSNSDSYDFLSKRVVILIDDGKVPVTDLYNLLNHFYKVNTHDVLLIRSRNNKEPVENKHQVVNDYLQSVECPPVEVVTGTDLVIRYGSNHKELRSGYDTTSSTTLRKYYAYIYDNTGRSSGAFSKRFLINDIGNYLGIKKAVYVILTDGYPEGGNSLFGDKHRAFVSCGLDRKYAIFGISKSNLSYLRRSVPELREFDTVLRSELLSMTTDKLTAYYSASAFDAVTTTSQIADSIVSDYKRFRSDTLRALIRHRSKISGVREWMSVGAISTIERIAKKYGIDNLVADREVDGVLSRFSNEFPLIKHLPTSGIDRKTIAEIVLYIETKDQKIGDTQ